MSLPEAPDIAGRSSFFGRHQRPNQNSEDLPSSPNPLSAIMTAAKPTRRRLKSYEIARPPLNVSYQGATLCTISQARVNVEPVGGVRGLEPRTPVVPDARAPAQTWVKSRRDPTCPDAGRSPINR
jgi:hypothetical protein